MGVLRDCFYLTSRENSLEQSRTVGAIHYKNPANFSNGYIWLSKFQHQESSKQKHSLMNGSRHEISDSSEPPSPRPSRSNSAFTPVNTSQQNSSQFSPRLGRPRGSSTPTSPVARRHSFNRSWTLGESPGSSLKSVKNSPPGSGKCFCRFL